MTRDNLLVRLPLIIRPTTLVICDQQKLFVILVINVLPRFQCVSVRGLGFKDQRHGAIVAFAIYFGGETFEAFHKNYGQPVWGVECHICEEELAITCILVVSFDYCSAG